MLRTATISGMGDGDDKRHSFDLQPAEFVRPVVTYPLRIVNMDNTSARLDAEIEDMKHKLQNDVFLSPGRLADIGVLLKQKIIQKLAPGISKPGYEETPEANNASSEDRAADGARPGASRNREPPRPVPHGDLPDPAQPRFGDMNLRDTRPRRDPGELYPPGFTDEYEINRPPGRGGFGNPPFGIGDRDLYPPGLGPNDPMRPFFGPRHPAGGTGGFGGSGGGGGMHPTFDDPLFGGRGGDGGYDPQAPPGARFDPVNPGQGPPRGSGGGPRGFGGAPPNPFGGFGGGDFI